jgi:hypothetical protein
MHEALEALDFEFWNPGPAFFLNPHVASALNGNNGEWTNTDDTFDHAERSGNRKRAANKKINCSLTPHKSKDGSEPKFSTICKQYPNCAFEQQTGKPCRYLHPEICFMDTPVVDDIPSYPPPPPPMPKRVLGKEVCFDKEFKIDKSGYEVVFSMRGRYDGKMDFVENPELPEVCFYIPQSLPAFRCGPVGFEHCDILYCYPLVEMLLRKFSVVTPDLRNLTAIRQEAHKNVALSREVIEGSYMKFVFDARLLYPERPDIELSFVSNMSRSLNGSYAVLRPLKITGVDCTLPLDWKFNRRWTMQSSKGFQFRTRGDEIFKYPSFDTFETGKVKVNYHALFKFCGAKDFAYYDNSPVNYTHSFARLFKAKQHEDQLFVNQLSLFHAFRADSIELMGAIGATLCPNVYEQDEEGVFSWTGASDTLYLKSRYVGKPGKESEQGWLEVPQLEDAMLAFLRFRSDKIENAHWYSSLVNHLEESGVKLYNNAGIVVANTKTALLERVFDSGYRFFHDMSYLGQTLELPTPKQRLYLQYYNDTDTWQKILRSEGSWESKVKKEPGKFGKVPRFYATGEQMALVDMVTPTILKWIEKESIALHEVWANDKGIKWYLKYADANDKKTSDELLKAINNLEDNTVLTVFFSDDGFTVARLHGKLVILETDISSSDSSFGPACFALLLVNLIALCGKLKAYEIILQCSKTTKVVNPHCRDEFAIFRPLFLFMFSGWKLTTGANNLASTIISFSAYLRFIEGLPLDAAFSEGAKRYGWNVTSDLRDTLAEVSFLKRSFVRDISFLNYGPIFRSFGVVDNMDKNAFGLTHAEWNIINSANDYESLLRILIQQKVSSLQHEPVSEVINALRFRVGLSPLPITLHINDLQIRYGCSTIEWSDFCEKLTSLRVGECLTGPVLDSIFKVDYGVEGDFPSLESDEYFPDYSNYTL